MALEPLAPPPAPSGQRILILAPHPDDEIVACGIAARHARRAGAELFVLYLTSGVPPGETGWPWRRRSYAARSARRRDEARAAAALLGLEPIEFLDIASRRLATRLDAAREAAQDALRRTRADCLWVTAFEGAHQDHDAANALAARFAARVPVWEFAAYNYAGGRVRSNRFLDARGGVIELRLDRDAAALKRRALALYPSERGNLAHIRLEQEAWRPLPHHDYGTPPHPGRLFRERFHWLPFRHPRVDFTASADIYSALGRWSAGAAGAASELLDIADAAGG
ncbi:MAG TPA: PIG-L family deacetylase [Stellaceae bacterium]|nr:PIG-L family deacetylase [Stellaceae bacterium]